MLRASLRSCLRMTRIGTIPPIRPANGPSNHILRASVQAPRGFVELRGVVPARYCLILSAIWPGSTGLTM